MYFTYVLKSLKERKYYTGHTDNLEKRLHEHNSGKNYYTRRFAPWEIIYQEEQVDLLNSVKREKYFKSAAGRRWLKKQVGL